ncbi:UvrD-helicase domain-containing protein [Pseudomonas oryzihabitans]|uniref:UvrD-helicase domain-containing protein n=1 Tax=Pseudomonas oryzihabitans TaxID=47885 RepID=UPI0015E321CE|nr:UvrD-helicase domain-containing protein [Pseudomonas psychrotolerans]MBA1259249.1 UvrD-helicase domain-containing protein [Pseudomonas psychrotolerans]
MYLALTQGMAEWLLPKIGVIERIHSTLSQIVCTPKILAGSIFIEGPFRFASNSEGTLLCLWHADYLSGTGDESLALIKLSGNTALFSEPGISKESLERSIYLANQRLQGLLVEGAFLHRKHEDNVHTLLAGRGTEARQYSLGYFDIIKGVEDSSTRTMISAGPSDSFRIVVQCLKEEIKNLEPLERQANKLISDNKLEKHKTCETLELLSASIKSYFEENIGQDDFIHAQINTSGSSITSDEVYKTLDFTFKDWLKVDSPLTEAQKKILTPDALDKNPIRILGPGGSGKTLLMQLLALYKVHNCKSRNEGCKILYIVHSDAMRSKVIQKFETLSNEDPENYQNHITVTTLSEYCRRKLGLELESILDPDATDAKLYQLQQILEALAQEKEPHEKQIKNSGLLNTVYQNKNLTDVFAKLVLAEISIAIKGHGYEQDRRRYVESERNLSRFHGILTRDERDFVFSLFEWYHREVFEKYGVLDPDDIALSLFGSIKTPVWRLRRKNEGFDYIFVDEAQLFNENERRLFSLLSNDKKPHIPIALALDEAQSFYGQSNAGLATLGIKDISNQNLDSIRRSTVEIAKLAFFVIQRSTNLFSSDFPDFTSIESFHTPTKDKKFGKPSLEKETADSRDFGRFIFRRVREMRADNIRQIAIISHTETYWNEIEEEFSKSDLPFQVLRERGEKIKADQPVVVLCRPAQVGGQEFDAVIIAGLEKGALTVKENPALESAIEQQMIRETYLSITRARYKVIFAISKSATENEILADAINANLIIRKQ